MYELTSSRILRANLSRNLKNRQIFLNLLQWASHACMHEMGRAHILNLSVQKFFLSYLKSC